ncbi:Sigma factor binding protein 1, chloroplastic [Morella rubra]|uniref:Sigma factor binding protein 1, chloroplastic n=1 Tax=Morella rubra TaxID=262757 RepID=A0A6A1WEA9_9ROSI|nr:Sigma factor binding protein 1, chloroplastic [Morella rubra]KAB1222217.1 Sigma factor binding protein 1, chloroplastic [Morella rubra]
MDGNLPTSVHQRKPTKRTKSKKGSNPIKVVYISNPMKVKTCASRFRALVQELTGQDAELPDPTKFSVCDNDVGWHQTVPDPVMKIGDDDHSPEVPAVDLCHEQPESSSCQFEPFDDVFTPQMIENLSGLFPANVFCESAQVDVLRRLDAA